jgi:type IV pilus assembly protein PilM
VDVLRESTTTSKDAGLAVPLAASLVSFVKMPNVDDKQLREMMPIEARKYIPVPVSEVTLDWSVVPREEAGYEDTAKPDAKDSIDVLLVVIHNEAIAKYQQIGQASGVAASFLEIELFSTIRAAADPSVRTQMIFDMGAGTTKLYVIERGILKNSHTINRGSQDITLAISKSMNVPVAEAETMKRLHGLSKSPEHKELADVITLTLDFIFYESNRVLLNYQKKYGTDIGKVVLTGGGVLLKGFAELAKSSFQSDVALADPFSKVEAPAFLEDILKTAGPEFAVALGVAMRKLQEGE